LVKIDVEGFEPQVLAEAREWLELHPPAIIVFELNDRGATAEHPTILALHSLGYRLLAIPKALLRLHLRPWSPSQPLPPSHDFVAVHASAEEVREALIS
jgi:hypothetical protein